MNCESIKIKCDDEGRDGEGVDRQRKLYVQTPNQLPQAALLAHLHTCLKCFIDVVLLLLLNVLGLLLFFQRQLHGRQNLFVSIINALCSQALHLYSESIEINWRSMRNQQKAMNPVEN